MGAAFNRDYFLTRDVMGEVGGTRTELLPGAVTGDETAARDLLKERMAILRTLSWQLIEHGDTLEGQWFCTKIFSSSTSCISVILCS